MKILSHSESSRKGVFGKIVMLGLLAMAAAILTLLNVAEHAVRTLNQPLLSFAASYSAHAAARRAEFQLSAGDAAGAEALAQSALERAPASAVALRVLALSLQERGSPQDAAQLMALAAGLGWRDTPTQAWLLSAYLQQEDFGPALERADALARRDQVLEPTIDLLLGAALRPQARPALIARLNADPPWRDRFFRAARRLPPDRYAAYANFLAEFAAEGALRKDEAKPFVRGLFKSERYAEAHRVWRLYGSRESATANAVIGGDFATEELAPSSEPSPFDWVFPQPPGSETEFAAPPANRPERALHVMSPGNARLEMARLVLVLSPGRHTVSYDIWGKRHVEGRGYSWLFTCLPNGAELEKSPPSIDQIAGGGLRYRTSIEVPSSGCPALTLRLLLHSGTTPLDLWFDNFTIEK